VRLDAPNLELSPEDLVYIKRVFRTVFGGLQLTVAYKGEGCLVTVHTLLDSGL
jgi:hypothetical protein